MALTAKTVLLVIDTQNVFAPMVKSAIPNIEMLFNCFDSFGQPTIFTQHGHTKEELTPPFKNQLVRKWGPDGSIAKVAKNTYDAFINTDLDQMLRDMEVERVVVCGVMTDCCCDTTARSAFNRGFETWLVADACGSANTKQHEAGLKGFGFAFGNVVQTKETIGVLSKQWSASL
ncbi:hypothetical protein LTR66_004175 [Elasticomyces elasticus]|nr:hypothetical protein LTR66_004175 [Elasticomyces elasticus]KAK5011104.1 hypothetical protein LTR28_005686 [Elasticomyces elasticus]